MSKIPDAWEDEWSAAADDSKLAPAESAEPRKVSSKVTKAQRRAQQAEFNRQLWAEAEGPKEANYFLESRNVVPLRSEYKAPPVLLSRKGPTIQSRSPRPPTAGIQDLSLSNDKTTPGQESSEDEDDLKAREPTLAERQAQAAKEREEKQKRYEERRKELFGSTTSGATSSFQPQGHNRSGKSSPASLTPPGSRSATPNRARGARGGRRGGAVGDHAANSRNQPRVESQQRELYDPSYGPKPDSSYIQRRERDSGGPTSNHAPGLPQAHVQQPVRAPKGPDGSGRGGFGFVRTLTPVQAATHNGGNLEPVNAEASFPNGTRVMS
ncbi:hypothetical protein A1O7_06261 [Cladophialophora yegresii CBS 114405]|uniref:Uncharacterized protein n=1 Tax=Cladophialophora yegresii CBS 114405 TaxID=1182544 RepID=W9W2U2_9EURO|nr:uncharacterized protein A1O7_06261 [Cladophialophora yegresii CBS 114405]EXJ58831.1 hypothetical protein A1O7_06261 [Cladophialophora yegresii CBS 114405]